MEELCLMRLMNNYLPTNLCGIPETECGYYEKLKWCITMMLFYALMVFVIRKYYTLISTGIVVRYGSYNRFVGCFIRDIIFCNVGWSVLNFIIVYHTISYIEGLIAVVVLSVNFVVKALFLFITPQNIVIVLFVVLEMVNVFSDNTLVFFRWAMYNQSEFVSKEGFVVFGAVMIQVMLIAIFTLILCKKPRVYLG